MKKRLLIVLILVLICFGQQRQDYTPALTSFNTGQVSPYLEARVDFKNYGSANRTVENMFVLTQGPVERRMGTEYIASAKSGIVRLISFEYSTDDSYIIEISDMNMGFYRTE